jgi:hypothetical protein
MIMDGKWGEEKQRGEEKRSEMYKEIGASMSDEKQL